MCYLSNQISWNWVIFLFRVIFQISEEIFLSFMNWCCQKEDGVSEFTGKKFWHWCGVESFLVKIAQIFMSRESQKKVIKLFCSGPSGYFFFVMVERSLHMRSKQMISRKNSYVSSSFKKIYLKAVTRVTFWQKNHHFLSFFVQCFMKTNLMCQIDV